MTDIEYDLDELTEKSVRVIESRKFFEADELAEYCLVDRKALLELFHLLVHKGLVVGATFESPARYFVEKDIQ